MEVGEAILALGAGERPASFDQFSAAIDPQWIADALAATDTASVRRRKLPAEHVVWLVIGMGLLRDRSIAQVVHHLDLVVPTPSGVRRRVTNAAIVQARDQLGAAPLAALFTQTAQAWAPTAAAADRWRGLAVYGLDGTTLRVADTPENVAHFGRPPSRHGEGAGYPQLRLVTLLAVRAHLLAPPPPPSPPRPAPAPSAPRAAASAPIASSPRSAPPPPPPPRSSPPSTTSAGNSNSPSTNSRLTPANASKRCAAKRPPAWSKKSGARCWPTTSSASS